MKKRILSAILCIILCFCLIPDANAADEIFLSAKSAIAVEADGRTVIYEKNAHERLPMASTTKIMTALVVLENCSLDHSFKVSDRAVGCEGTSAYLQSGDTLTVEGALYALLLQSANDVACALAYEVSGSIEAFADLMNEKAKEIGVKNTSFKNPSGLPADGHYTTAYDLAIISCTALDNEDFKRIVSAKTAVVTIGNRDQTFINHNKLLSLYDGAIGVKTGFTKESGRCLVGAAERDGVRLVTVTLSASSDWNDHKTMFNYGFPRLRSFCLCEEGELMFEIPVAGANSLMGVAPQRTEYVTLKSNEKIELRIEAQKQVFTPINKGDTLGYAVFSSNGHEIRRIPLEALSDHK